MTFTPDMLGDVLVGEAIESHEDHPRPLGDGLGTGAGAHDGLEDGLLPLRDDELVPSLAWFRLPVLSL